MNTTQKAKGIVAWLKANPIFLGLFLAECMVLIFLGFRLFRAPLQMELYAENFQVLEEGSFQVTEAEGELRIYSPDPQGEPVDCLSDFLSVPGGAYTLSLQYETPDYMEAGASLGVLSVRSFRNPSGVASDETALTGEQTTAATRVYVGLMSKLEDMQLVIRYHGGGVLTIKGATLQEETLWRWAQLASFLLLFLVLDFLYCLLFGHRREGWERMARRHWQEGCLALVVLFASLPLLGKTLFYGHDLSFHLARIGALAEQLAMGQLPVRMLGGMLKGYGYPTSLFYCDIFLYLPALMYNAMFPLMACYQVYLFCVHLFTSIAAYLSFGRIAQSKTIGLVCAAMYTLSPQRLMTLYERQAAGEATAMVFLPLILWGMWNVYQKADSERIAFRDYLPLSLGVAGLMLCHVLTLEMAGLFLMGVGLCLFLKTFRIKRLWALIKAAVLAVALGLWFLGPMLESVTGMSIWANQVGMTYKIQSAGLSFAELLQIFQGIEGKGLGLPVMLGAMLTGYGLLHWNRWHLEDDGHAKLIRVGCIVAIAALVLTTDCFPWDGLEGWIGPNANHFFCAIQFPWRYMTIALPVLIGVCAATLALFRAHQHTRYRWALAMLAGSVVLSAGYALSTFTDKAEPVVIHDYRTIPQQVYGSIGAGEYLLSDVDIVQLLNQAPEPVAQGDALHLLDYARIGRSIQLTCENGESVGRITLPLFAYEHYEAVDQRTGERLTLEAGENKRLVAVIPQGYQGVMSIAYTPPIRWRIYEGVSLGAFLFTAALLFRERKARKRPSPLACTTH